MTAADLQAVAADAKEQTLHIQGVTEQVRLRGLTTETPILDAKLRNMDPALLALIRTVAP